MISGEYGWTDDQILDLTMPRMRQIREVIWERSNAERRRDLQVREIELRTLASYMAQTEEAAANVSSIHLLAPEVDDAGEPVREVNMIPYEKAQRWFGG